MFLLESRLPQFLEKWKTQWLSAANFPEADFWPAVRLVCPSSVRNRSVSELAIVRKMEHRSRRDGLPRFSPDHAEPDLAVPSEAVFEAVLRSWHTEPPT